MHDKAERNKWATQMFTTLHKPVMLSAKNLIVWNGEFLLQK